MANKGAEVGIEGYAMAQRAWRDAEMAVERAEADGDATAQRAAVAAWVAAGNAWGAALDALIRAGWSTHRRTDKSDRVDLHAPRGSGDAGLRDQVALRLCRDGDMDLAVARALVERQGTGEDYYIGPDHRDAEEILNRAWLLTDADTLRWGRKTFEHGAPFKRDEPERDDGWGEIPF